MNKEIEPSEKVYCLLCKEFNDWRNKEIAKEIFADLDNDIKKGKGSIILTKHKLEIKKKKYLKK